MSAPVSEQSIFLHAIGLGSLAERAAYLDDACRDNPALRAELDALLAAHDRLAARTSDAATVTLDGPAPTSAYEAAPLGPGTVIAGRYKLLEEIGEGGMGSVWMAEQTEPVSRRVAVKLIRLGMDSRQVLARFDAERQALALMDHPNIAKVLDGGATADGRPYFVMELVKGVPITKYCDEKRLPIRDRLSLFADVCRAVQHAHQKGVIHRDIKPGNVLVAPYDGRPVVKVIDFGVAKATGQKLTAATLFTGFGAVVGTPEYMSPEQAEMNNQDVDTRSDVYSLGVLLYELLTGTTPITRKRVKEGALLEVLRVIREEEPPRPSTRLSTTAELPSIAAVRGVEPAKLSRLVRGELDWIVMKALEKNRNRRYETANAFAADLQRFLADEPVQACPPSAWYRFGKSARKNKAALTTAAVVVLALVLGVVGLAADNVRVQARELAKQQALEQKLQAEADRADAEQKKAEAEQSRADAERKKADALEVWRQMAHYRALSLAFNEFRANNVARADRMLEDCEKDLRHWEWHYLKRLCHDELSGVTLEDVKGIGQAVMSPDATRIATQLGAFVNVYDSATGKQLKKMPSAPRALTQPAFSSDGKWITTCVHDPVGGTLIRVGNAQTGEPLATLKGPNGPPGNELFGLAAGPDAQVITATDKRGGLYAWGRDSGELLFHVRAHVPADIKPNEMYFTQAAFSHDGSLLVTACESDSVLKLWDGQTGKPVQSITVSDGCSRAIFSPKGTWVAAAGKYLSRRDATSIVWVCDTKTGKIRRVLYPHASAVTCLAFSPDEKVLATGSPDHLVTLWEVETGRELATYRGHKAEIVAVAFSTDGSRLVSVDRTGVVKARDATHAPEALTLRCRLSFHAAFSPDGRYLAAAANHPTKKDWTGIVWDTLTGKEVDGFGVADDEMCDISQVAYSPDGKFIAAAHHGGNIGWVRLWNVTTGRFDRRFPQENQEQVGPCFAVAYSRDGKLLAAGGGDRVVHVWDTTTGVEKYRFTGHPRSVTALAFSADGRRLASSAAGLDWEARPFQENPLNLKGDKKTDPTVVKVWDMETGKEVLALPGPHRPLPGIALSPDGRTVAITSMDHAVRLYDVTTGKEGLILRGHTAPPRAVAFSPDGQRIATAGGSDRSVKLWDVKTGEEVHTFNRVAGKVDGVAFSPCGHKIVATSSADDVVTVWDATPPKK